MQASCESYGVSDVLYRPLKKAASQEAAFFPLRYPLHPNRLYFTISTPTARYPRPGCGGHRRFP